MIEAILRKARRFAQDPVLRRWLVSLALGRSRRPAQFRSHRPPYLKDIDAFIDLSESPNREICAYPALSGREPEGMISLPLPGESVELWPGRSELLFDREFPDVETLLAVHRFAWLPLLGQKPPLAWVDVLWRGWMERYATPDESWAWHPYTAAERAINILDFARRNGIPGELGSTLDLIARHAAQIAARLEYFGDHDTSNHLSNNGRGIYRIGLELGLPGTTDFGLRILLAEADRIFLPSGVLREGSAHYHLLLTRNYADVWLAARRHARPEVETLQDIVRRALAAIPHLVLPGGLPLIGDISPDCPPAFLSGLLPGMDEKIGWCALLDEDDFASLQSLKHVAQASIPVAIAQDGWHRVEHGRWAALCHIPPKGWPPMPGHSHQDMGSFELHFAGMPLFVDPGRGAYGDDDIYTSAGVHNSFTIDGFDPYPPNKPYYDDAFRESICGPSPRIENFPDGLEIVHTGYRRLSDLGEARRRLAFSDNGLTIVDRMEGAGRHVLRSRLCTPWPAKSETDGVYITTPRGIFRIRADVRLHVQTALRWIAYGISAPAQMITVEATCALPGQLRLSVDLIVSE